MALEFLELSSLANWITTAATVGIFSMIWQMKTKLDKTVAKMELCKVCPVRDAPERMHDQAQHEATK